MSALAKGLWNIAGPVLKPAAKLVGDHLPQAVALGAGGYAVSGHVPGVVNKLTDRGNYGREQMRADAGTMAGSADAILKGLALTGLLTGVGTGVSHIMRDRASGVDDADTLQADVNAMGAVPQRKKFRKRAASIVPPEWFIDQDAYAKAPESAGQPAHGGGILNPWWALPGIAAGLGAGYLGGKGLADMIGYGLRERPIKKRYEKAKQEFEETVAGQTKGAALERRLDDGYAMYKQSSMAVGALAAGMGGLGLLSALAAYRRFKNPEPVDVYRRQLSRYLEGGARRPIVRVRPSTELALEREDEEMEFADKEAAYPLAGQRQHAQAQQQQTQGGAQQGPVPFP